MATTHKATLFTGREVEFTSLQLKHFDLFLHALQANKPLLQFYIDLLIDEELLVAVSVLDDKGNKHSSKNEKDKLTLLACEVYHLMTLVREKTLGKDVQLVVEWNGKEVAHQFHIDENNFAFKKPSEAGESEITLSNGKTVIIQKGTIGQMRKHAHLLKGDASQLIAMHNPREKREDGKPPISLSLSEIKQLSWVDAPKLTKLCGEANGSFSYVIEVKNPQQKSEVRKIDLLSTEGFAGFFGLQESE